MKQDATGVFAVIGRVAGVGPIVGACCALLAASAASADVLHFEFAASPSSQVSCVLGDFAGSMGVAASGSMTIDWDRAGARVRVTALEASVTSLIGGMVVVPVPIGFVGPVNVRHESMTLDLEGDSLWAELSVDGSWFVSGLPLRMHAHCTYQGEAQPCGQLFNTTGGTLSCSGSVELGDRDPTLAEVHSAHVGESNGEVTLSACLRVRVPHNVNLPGLAWSIANVCFTAIATGPSCASDANGDGVSDLSDLLLFLSDWLPRLGGPGPGTLADFAPDGIIDLVDLLAYLEVWLAGCP